MSTDGERIEIDRLPFVDEHVTAVAAGVDDVWAALVDTLDRGFSRRGSTCYARVVGCADRTAAGVRPLAAGSTFPGFHVAAAVPGTELALAGEHRFSSYALIFHLEAVGPDRSRLRAETRAMFPGIAGGVYRLLVIGTRGHVVVVTRLLSDVRRRSELRASGPSS